MLKGKVFFEDFPLQAIEIINLNTEKISISANNGHFEIEVEVGQQIIIGNALYNPYLLTIKKEHNAKKDIKFFLTKRVEVLQEVEVSTMQLGKIKLERNDIANNRVLKENAFPNEINNRNPIPNGMNLIEVGRLFGKLAKNIFNIQPKKPTVIDPEINIQNFLDANFKPNYAAENLLINADQLYLFFEFCKADAQFQSVFKTENALLISEFLTKKSIVFKMNQKK